MAEAMHPDFKPFYEHVANGELRFPRCEVCGRFHWYPMKLCPHCCSPRIGWTRVDGRARLYSWTRVEHGFDAAFAERLPYIVALVEFDDAPGVRYVTNIVGAASESLRIGMPLKPAFPAGEAIGAPVLFTATDTELRSRKGALR